MIINPIIPVWLMAILCVLLFFFKKKGTFHYIRQITVILLLFVINLRIMVPNHDVTAVQKDIDVLFVVDNTISMIAQDYGPDQTLRLDAVRNDCSYIMQHLPGAAFSVVSFGNEVKNMLPYTIDTSNVEQALRTLNGQSYMYATGTGFEDVLTYLEDFLNRDNEHLQIVFFISDGEITTNDVLGSHPGLASLIDGGAVLGYGTETGGPMMAHAFVGDDREEYLTYYDENYNKQTAISIIDEANLEQIASDMDVDYIHMTKPGNVDKVIADIRHQMTEMDNSSEHTSLDAYSDTYFYLLIPLLLLLVADFVYYKRKVNF